MLRRENGKLSLRHHRLHHRVDTRRASSTATSTATTAAATSRGTARRCRRSGRSFCRRVTVRLLGAAAAASLQVSEIQAENGGATYRLAVTPFCHSSPADTPMLRRKDGCPLRGSYSSSSSSSRNGGMAGTDMVSQRGDLSQLQLAVMILWPIPGWTRTPAGGSAWRGSINFLRRIAVPHPRPLLLLGRLPMTVRHVPCVCRIHPRQVRMMVVVTCRMSVWHCWGVTLALSLIHI